MSAHPGGRTSRSPRTLLFLSILTSTAALMPTLLTAAELIVESRVVDVVPVFASRMVPEQVGDCDPPRPDGSDLSALLAWDLRAHCRTETREQQYLDGYRVSYEWQDRVHELVLSERPGDTITLRVRLD